MIGTGLHGTAWPWGIVPREQSDSELIGTQIKRCILTGIGERKMEPTFGSKVLKLIFENKSNAMIALARREIIVALSKMLDNVSILKIDFEFGEEDNDPVGIVIEYEYMGDIGRIKEVLG